MSVRRPALRGALAVALLTPVFMLSSGGDLASAAPGPPRVVGAIATSNTTVAVAFSEPMAQNALERTNYQITQENVNPEAGSLRVVSVDFDGADRSRVLLTTMSQAELLYRVTVVGVNDRDGDALAPKVVSGGVLVDPTSAVFLGAPPVAFVDSDGDGLADSVESRGWSVPLTMIDGTRVVRGVSSDPEIADTDGDGLDDAQEANLRLDPRSGDSDDDRLGDYAEFNEIYSDALSQDTDGDGLDDSLEFEFFRTSPIMADTDGDQIDDNAEVIGHRNPRVADLPRPEIEVGEVRLALDVGFTETNSKERRNLDTKSVSSTLVRSDTASFSRQDTITVEAHLDAGTRDGTDAKLPFVRGGASLGYTFQQTDTSETETQQAYERSLTTDREVTEGYVAEREVRGAVMQVTVSLRNVSSLAYRVENMQVTAFIQDPRDRGRLTPVATLLPDAEPDGGFVLGPLVTDRGPFVFSNTTIVPSLVDSLMANSTGLIFRISNYDITDEDGRNFAFSSQEVVERTARLVFDYGGARSLRALVGDDEDFDENEPGDETELHRVATNHGRAIADTNGDGRIDGDPQELFDAAGTSIGIDTNGDGVVTETSYLVTDVAWSPDGATLATASDDGVVRLWSPFTGQVRASIAAGDGAPIGALAWSPDGASIAVGRSDAAVAVFDVATRSRVAEFVGHALAVTAVGWSRSGALIASGGAGGDVIVRDAVAGTEVYRFTAPSGAITEVSWSADDALLAASSLDGRVRVWNVADGRLARTLTSHAGPVNDVAFSPDGALLASAGADGDIRLWDGVSLGAVRRLDTDDAVAAIDWSPDGSAILAGGDAAPIRIWDAATGTSDRLLTGHAGPVLSVDWSPLGDRVASSANDYNTKIWDAADDELTRTLTGLDDESYIGDTRVVFDDRGRLVGTTLHEAMAAIGLIRYDEDTTPTANLTYEQRLASYSTRVVDGVERLHRIRGIANDDVAQKYWQVLTSLGVDADADIGDLVVTPGSAVSLSFVQDLDEDGLTADVEYFIRTSDSPTSVTTDPRCGATEPTAPRGRDTDGDCLDDRFEALIGWTVSIPQRSYPVWSSPNRADSNFDDPECVTDPSATPPVDCPYDSSDTFAAPAGWVDTNANHLRDPGEVSTVAPDPNGVVDYVLDPIRRDTDLDGVDDADEINGFTIERLTDTIFRRTDPLRPDTDGDTFPDGFERSVGLDPTDPADTDVDGDGLPDDIETTGWDVTIEQVSTQPHTAGVAAVVRSVSNPRNPDTDGDGLSDLDEFLLAMNAASVDSDGDGIRDDVELSGYTLPHQVDGRDLGIIATLPLDADTDNDKRGDGAEAELRDVETARWVVRVLGEAPYRVYSDPLVADADFDSLVDGDEFVSGTDPTNGNTDGDRRPDDVEARLGTNPLAVDLRVTVVAESLTVSPADLQSYSLTVRRPDEAGAAGLSPTPTTVFSGAADRSAIDSVTVSSSGAYVGKVSFRWVVPGTGQVVATGEGPDHLVGQTRTYDPAAFGVPNDVVFWPVVRAVAGNTVSAGERFTFRDGSSGVANYSMSGTTLGVGFAFLGVTAVAAPPQARPLAERSITFGVAEGQRFSIEGTLQRSAGSTVLLLGGLEGARALRVDPTNGSTTTVRPVFTWDQIADKFVEDYQFTATVDGANATLKFYFIVQ